MKGWDIQSRNFAPTNLVYEPIFAFFISIVILKAIYRPLFGLSIFLQLTPNNHEHKTIPNAQGPTSTPTFDETWNY